MLKFGADSKLAKDEKLRKEKKKLSEIPRKHGPSGRLVTLGDEDKKLCIEKGTEGDVFFGECRTGARYFRSTQLLLAVQREIAGITVVQSPYLVVSLP